MRIIKYTLIGIPVSVTALLIADTWASGWFSCMLFFIAAHILDTYENKHNKL